MKGKKAAAAANRRDREELEQRATAAEHAANRLTGELAELQRRTENEIQALRTALADARKQRDQGASPALAEAEKRIRTLREEVEEHDAKYEELQKSYSRQFDHFVSYLRTTGLSNLEAIEVVGAGVIGRTISLVAESSGVASKHADGSGEMVRRIQAAKGFRSAPLLSHHIAEKILAATREQEEAEAARKGRTALLGAAALHPARAEPPLGETS